MEKVGYIGFAIVGIFILFLLVRKLMRQKYPILKDSSALSVSHSTANSMSPVGILAGGIAMIIIFLVDYFDLYSYVHFITKYWEY